MIDIPKARALCAAATRAPWGSSVEKGTWGFWCAGPIVETRDQAIADMDLVCAARTGWEEALDALEEEQHSKKRGWALAMEHADTVNALKAENARLRKALRAAIPYVSATSINAEMWAALAAPQTGGDDE